MLFQWNKKSAIQNWNNNRFYDEDDLWLLMQGRRVQIRHRARISSSSLLGPYGSPWRQLYEYGDDGSFIQKKFYHFNWHSGNGGRPSSLKTKNEVLGLILMFYTGVVEYKSLCGHFGIPPSTILRILRKAEVALLETVKQIPDARILWPTQDLQRRWGDLVTRKEPLLTKKWGFIDGKNYRVQKPSESELQNSMYNGSLHQSFVTGVMCFGADGTIVWGRHNFSGSWNDRDMSRIFFDKLLDENISLQDYGVISDTAFPVTGPLQGRIVTPLKENDLDRVAPDLRGYIQSMSNVLTRCRQACEWGMGGPCKVYRQLLLPLPIDKERRQLRLDTIHRLFNYRVRKMHISEIRNHFGE